MIDQVSTNIARHRMLAPGDRLGVAVSGGADSVVLLHILHRLSSVLQIDLHVLHANHHLRGEESNQDEAFVRELASELNLPISVGDGSPVPGNLEQEARKARRTFFEATRQRNSLARIALGHTRSDQAETILYRLFRGSGLAGLAGMRIATDDGYIRPMLTLLRSEIRDWAVAEGIRWREDSTNAALDFARNRLRNEFIPAVTQHFNPNLETVLARLAQLAQDEEDYLFQQVEPLFFQTATRTRHGLVLNVLRLTQLHPALQRRLIRRSVAEVKGDLRSLDLTHVDRITGLCSTVAGHDRVLVPGIDALRSFDSLLIRPSGRPTEERNYEILVVPGEPCHLPFGAGSISVNWVKPEVYFCVKFKEEQELASEVADFDADALTGRELPRPLYVRNWEPGDRVRRVGHDSPEKLKALFQEYKVLLWERRHWPVLISGDEIVWVRGFGGAVEFAASQRSSRVVRLVYRRSVK